LDVEEEEEVMMEEDSIHSDFECGSSADSDDSVFAFEYTWSCGGNDDPMSFPDVPKRKRSKTKRRRTIDERVRTMNRFKAMPPEAWRPLSTITFLGASRYMRHLSSGRLDDPYLEGGFPFGPVFFDEKIGPPGAYFFLADDRAPDPWTNAKVCHAIFGLGRKKRGPPYVCVRNIINTSVQDNNP